MRLDFCYTLYGDKMRKVEIKDVNPKVPGLLLTGDGKAYVMEEETHDKFFKKVLKEEFDLDVTEDNLGELCYFMMKEYKMYPYIGCTFGDRKFNGGTLIVDKLENLSTGYLQDSIDLYSSIDKDYTMDIISISDKDRSEQEVSIGEIYEELINRDSFTK